MTGSSVLVALSGGVDSAVAAALLIDQGYSVSSMTLELTPPDLTPSDTEGARLVAEHLGIPHHLVDARSRFNEVVIRHFRNEYRMGRTPNPCVRCNALVKFSLLLHQADRLGFDRIATGHYARITADPDGTYSLRRGSDDRKDQSYFLYALAEEQLERTVFPLGYLSKEQVRTTAAERGIPAHEHESQELCFVTGDYRTLFTSVQRPGPIVDPAGRVLGEHRGLAGYTVGQRRGLGLSSSRPLYVTGIDPTANTLVVGTREQVYQRELLVPEVHWQEKRHPAGPIRVQVQIRYAHRPAGAVLYPGSRGARVRFDRPQWAVTPGQSAVFYRGDLVMGGGVIAAAEAQLA